MNKKLKGMNYGEEDVIESDLDINKSKIRITTMIDYPVCKALKEEAERNGGKYQTLINKILSDYVKANKSKPRAILSGEYQTSMTMLMKEMRKQVKKEVTKEIEHLVAAKSKRKKVS